MECLPHSTSLKRWKFLPQKTHQGFNTFPANSFKKYKIKTNLKMCMLMYFKIQSDQPRLI